MMTMLQYAHTAWPRDRSRAPSLAQCAAFALLLHLLALLVFGTTPGGSARSGEGVWGRLNITLRGLQAEDGRARTDMPDVAAGPPGDAPRPRAGGVLRAPAEQPRADAAPGAAARGEWADKPTAPAPQALPADTPAPELTPLMPPTPTAVPVPAPIAAPAPVAAPAPAPAAAPAAVEAPAPVVVPGPSPVPTPAPAAAPAPEPAPVAPPPAPAPVRPPVPAPAPVPAPPVPVPAPVPAPAPVAAPAPVQAPAPAPPQAAPVTASPPAEPAPAPEPPRQVPAPEAPRPEAVKPAPAPAATPVAPSPSPQPTPAPPSTTGSRPTVDAVPSRGEPGAPNAGPTMGQDVATPPSAPASAPRLNLDYVRPPRGGELSRDGSRGVLQLLPHPPERKSKLAEDIEKAGKPDCRKAYADMGLLGAVPLAANALRADSTCKW